MSFDDAKFNGRRSTSQSVFLISVVQDHVFASMFLPYAIWLLKMARCLQLCWHYVCSNDKMLTLKSFQCSSALPFRVVRMKTLFMKLKFATTWRFSQCLSFRE